MRSSPLLDDIYSDLIMRCILENLNGRVNIAGRPASNCEQLRRTFGIRRLEEVSRGYELEINVNKFTISSNKVHQSDSNI